jgi:phosphatidylinositol glycan class P protein
MADNTAVYAFVGWMASVLSYGIFLLWAIAPDSFLKEIGITYYPSRYYALALPSYILVLIIFIIVVYISINMMYTNELDSIYCIRDEYSKRAPTQAQQLANTRSIPDIGDVDIRYISIIHGRVAVGEDNDSRGYPN